MPISEDEIDVGALLRTMWNRKWIILAIAGFGALCAIVYALTATEIYRAEALIQPRQEPRASGALGVVAAQFGGIADFAGFSLGGGGDRAVAIATLKSRMVIEAFITEKNLLQRLYESRWDAAGKKWKTEDPRKAPTVWQAYNDFTKGVLGIAEDKKTGLVTVSVDWRDPVEAQQWLADLIARTNEHLRMKAIQEGEANLAYLGEQSKKIVQVELQNALYGLVEVEMKKLMLARGGNEFAMKTIDPAVVPQRRIRPKRSLIAVLGLLLGAGVGATFVLTQDALRRRQAI